MLAPTANAEPLVGHRVAVGVNADGSLCDDGLGIRYDPSSEVDDAPVGSDLLTPGRDFETWNAEWSDNAGFHRVTAGAPDFPGGPIIAWDEPQIRDDFRFIEGTTEQDGLSIHVAVDVPVDGDHFWVTTTFTAAEAVSGLMISRTVDADPDFFVNGSYRTNNAVNGSIAVSSSQRTGGKAVALAVEGGQAGICADWCRTPAEVLEGSVEDTVGDDVIGVALGPIDLAAGEVRIVRYAYGLGTSAEAATSEAAKAMLVNDLDGDGMTAEDGDCDDRDRQTYLGATEVADDYDNDCDDIIDEDTPVSDDDGDGYSEEDGDCDDSDANIYPGAPANPDVADADCDGLADEDPFADGERPDGWGVDPDPPRACAHSSFSTGIWLLILPLLGLRRRR